MTAHKAQYAVSALCRILCVSRSWMYGFQSSQQARDRRLSDRAARDQVLLAKITRFFRASRGCYGSKRIHQDLLSDGEIVSERRVAKIMQENRVSPRLCKPRKPRTTDSNHKMKPSPNLLEQQFHCLINPTQGKEDGLFEREWIHHAAAFPFKRKGSGPGKITSVLIMLLNESARCAGSSPPVGIGLSPLPLGLSNLGWTTREESVISSRVLPRGSEYF